MVMRGQFRIVAAEQKREIILIVLRNATRYPQTIRPIKYSSDHIDETYRSSPSQQERFGAFENYFGPFWQRPLQANSNSSLFDVDSGGIG